MTVNKFIKKLLRLKDLKVKHFEFREKKKILYLWVKPYKNGSLCPQCKRRCSIKRIMPIRSWKDLPISGYSVIFLYHPKEIFCPTHGRGQEEIPWADNYARMTHRFEYALLTYCQIMTQKAVAQLLKLPKSTLSDLLHRCIYRIRKNHRIRGLTSIGIDEISYCKGHKYATIVYDLKKSSVVWVGKGKSRKTIDKFFNEQLSAHQRAQIKFASCDMSQTYIGAIEEHCPKVTLVLDRFHIVKAMNEALDAVRKEEWNNIPADKRKILKGLRWILFKHSSNRSKEDTQILNALNKSNRRIYRAWVIKDEFEQLWNYKSISVAEKFLKGWITTALKSRLKSICKFVSTIKSHMHRILPFVETHLSNAKAEGINRIIKIIKNRASGFQNLKSFADLIFLTIGDLNIPAQISIKFRAI